MTTANIGDIVYVKRKGYRHFGIYTGNQQVIHYHKEKNPLLCDGIITETSLTEFMSSSDTLYVLNGIGPAAKNNLFDWIIKRVFGDEVPLFSPQETIDRARSKLGEQGYSLLLNNCEHFAFWCKTGMAKSAQVDEILSYFLLFVPSPPPEQTTPAKTLEHKTGAETE